MKLAATLCVTLFALAAAVAPLDAAPRKSLLDNDPEVIYLENHTDNAITLLVSKPATVYATKNGGRRLGTFKPGTRITLLAITGKAYRVKGKASHAGVTGWVNPKLLTSPKDKNFIANLKQLYQRQMAVKELIANHDVAIGMTLPEVSMSLGEPTKTEVRQTKDGESGKWDYVETEQHKHYRIVIDRCTGRAYRQFSHITTEEKSRVTVEFHNGLVTAVTRKTDKGPGKVRIIPAPVVFCW